MKFTIGGLELEITREQIEERLARVEPEELRQVFVVVAGRKFPIKQALAVGAGIVRSGFTTQDALRILRKLGFEVGERPVTFQLRTQVVAGFPQFWDAAMETFPNFWTASSEIAPLANQVFTVSVNEPLHLLTRNLAKSVVNSFSAVLVLALNGCGFDALKIGRSMFECAVTVAHLHRHPEEMPDFVDYDWIKKKKFVDDLEKYSPDLARVHDHEKAEILRNYNAVVGRFTSKGGRIRGRWSKSTLAKMAADLGFSHLYFSIYNPGSSAQHMDIRGLMMQFEGSHNPGVADIVAAPHLQWVQPALLGGHISVFLAVTHYTEIAGIDCPDIKHRLEAGIHSAWPTEVASVQADI